MQPVGQSMRMVMVTNLGFHSYSMHIWEEEDEDEIEQMVNGKWQQMTDKSMSTSGLLLRARQLNCHEGTFLWLPSCMKQK